MITQNYIGDPHNGGKRVFSEGSRVFKPRNIFWEHLFLSKDSDFWFILNSVLSKKDKDALPSNLFPNLKFWPDSNDGMFASGYVEKLSLRQINPSDISIKQFEEIGSLIAFLSWVGIGDLCKSNIMLGTTFVHGNLVLAPIDIESVFNDFMLPSQTSLLPSRWVDDADCGLADIMPFLRREAISCPEIIAAICIGYINFLNSIQKYNDIIDEKILSIDNIDKIPVRVLLRSTRIYSSNNEKLEEDELIQIKRGDIPYFFRFLFKKGIFYYNSDDLKTSATVSSELQSEALKFARYTSCQFNKHGRQRAHLLTKAGILQIIKMFFNKINTDISYNGMKIIVDSRKVKYSYHGISAESK